MSNDAEKNKNAKLTEQQTQEVNKEKLLKTLQVLKQAQKSIDGISTTDIIRSLRSGEKL